MEWSNELTLLLIELYRTKPCLWDPKDNNYRIKSVKNAAWRDISEVLKCSSEEARRKMDSVLASFRRERQRQLKAGADGSYISSWFAFNQMLFLMDKFQTRIFDNDDYHVLKEEPETEGCNAVEEQPAVSLMEEPAETRNDLEIPQQQTLPKKKKRYLQSTPYRTYSDAASRRVPRDECAVFGEYIATKLRRYSDYTKNIVQNLISNIVFEADMGKYNETPASDDNFYSPFVITQASSPCSSA